MFSERKLINIKDMFDTHNIKRRNQNLQSVHISNSPSRHYYIINCLLESSRNKKKLHKYFLKVYKLNHFKKDNKVFIKFISELIKIE